MGGGMTLSKHQHDTIRAICGTLIPSLDREPDPAGFFAHGALATDAPERVARLISSIRDTGNRRKLELLLNALDSRLVNLVLHGIFARFTDMTRPQRESVLVQDAHAALPARRAGFQALKRLTQLAYYCWPLENGSHPAWDHVGYPGPLSPPERQLEALPETKVERDTELSCDVVVVGSGAGGGVVAGILAEADLDVVVLEKGPNVASRDMTQIEGEMLSQLYLDGGLIMTQSGSMPILAGSCVGGGTTINWTSSFPPPEYVREEWDRIGGLSLFTTNRFTESLNWVRRRLGVTDGWSAPGNRDRILEEGCRALGWHVETMPRNVTDCKEGLECGYCGYGCRHGAKNSTARTYLQDASRRGMRLVTRCEVTRIRHRRGRVTGLEALVDQPDGRKAKLDVRAQLVVVCAGAIYTPAILKRSGLRNRRIGKGLRLHPATAVIGYFERPVEPWSGTLQARYSDQLADQDGGYGTKFETGPVHFALPSSAFGWQSAQQSREDISRLAHLGLVGVLLRDRDSGRVSVGRGTQPPRVRYELSQYDVNHVRNGLKGAARILETDGAKEVSTLQTPPVKARPGKPGWLDEFISRVDGVGYRYCRMSYITFHQMASAAMGGDRVYSVVSETGETHDLKGLYVADGSTFPTSSGVNPMVTIMAVADHVARYIRDSW